MVNSMDRTVAAAAGLFCVVALAACSGSAAGASSPQTHPAFVSQAAPDSHVLLVPIVGNVAAGSCLATATRTATGGVGGCSGGPTPRGPILAETCSSGTDTTGEVHSNIYALTTSEVAAVAVEGGTPISTATNGTLPDRLRAVAVELLWGKAQPAGGSEQACRRLTPLDASGQPIRARGRRWPALSLPVPNRRWIEPAHSPRGVCELKDSELPAATNAFQGEVATRIKPEHGLLGRPLLSCASTTFIYSEEHHLPAAVLLSASHPGAAPPPLPGMVPLAGHPGIFEAPGQSGQMAARRIPGGWLVVQEEDGIGLRVPLEILHGLRARIHV
jgi:hypothetical protein